MPSEARNSRLLRHKLEIDMIHIGTSGFSYNDWIGPVYPQGTKKRDMLALYSELFSTVELNFTYYGYPSIKAILSIVEKSEGKLVFSVKAHQDITHKRENITEAAEKFIKGIDPLKKAETLGAVLLQFPWSFKNNKNNRRYLAQLPKLLPDLPLVAEFRNSDWIQPPLFDFLRYHNLGFCCVDQPQLKDLLPPMQKTTSSIGYVRFHGRNAAKWWTHDKAYERYDYLYNQEELSPWVDSIKQMDRNTDRTFVFMNNHYRGQAVENARMLIQLIEKNND